MELYEIRATCTNNNTTRTLDYIPENFQGVKITQKFNWQNPMGYTPTFSVETMKVIKADKVWLDAIVDTYGFDSIVSFAIYKLNSTATDYVLNSIFAIDFESLQKMDFYTEFALKSMSCIDTYNLIKNSDVKFTIDYDHGYVTAFPSEKKYLNYVSLENEGDPTLWATTAILNFKRNNEERVYNNDSALYNSKQNVYEIDRSESGLMNFGLTVSASFSVAYSGMMAESELITVKMYQNNWNTPVYDIYTGDAPDSGNVNIDINIPKTKAGSAITVNNNDVFFIGIKIGASSVAL